MVWARLVGWLVGWWGMFVRSDPVRLGWDRAVVSERVRVEGPDSPQGERGRPARRAASTTAGARECQ